jgi:hypothetical protein
MLCTVHSYLWFSCFAHFIIHQLPSPLKLFHCSVYCSRMKQLRVQVTVASYRMLQLVQYSHAQCIWYSVVIRHTFPWSLSSVWVVIRKMFGISIFEDTSWGKHSCQSGSYFKMPFNWIVNVELSIHLNSLGFICSLYVTGDEGVM